MLYSFNNNNYPFPFFSLPSLPSFSPSDRTHCKSEKWWRIFGVIHSERFVGGWWRHAVGQKLNSGSGTNLQAVASGTHSWAEPLIGIIWSQAINRVSSRWAEVRLTHRPLSPEVIFSGSDQCATITRLSLSSLVYIGWPAPTIGRGGRGSRIVLLGYYIRVTCLYSPAPEFQL